MALGLTARGTGTHNTGAASFTLSPSGNFAAGSLAVLKIAADNSSSGGATNDFTTVTDSIGNTWTRQRNPVFDNGAASAGVQAAIFTTPQNVGPLQTGTVITVNFGSSPVAKTWTLDEVTHAANAEAVVIGGADQAGATTGTPSFASSSIAVGDAVLFMVAMEAGTTQSATGDADTTNGSWSTQQYAEIGSTTSGSAIASQGKVQTTTPSAQTYNPTLGLSVDLLVSYIIVHEQHTASASVTAAGGGILTSTRVKAASSSPTRTGGGVVSTAETTNRNSPVASTAGGTASVARTAGRQAASALTGAGMATLDVVAEFSENHDASITTTGGGTLAPAIASARNVAPALSAAGVVSPIVATARSVAAVVAGGGAVAPDPTTARGEAPASTGAGALSVAYETARLAAALLSGGGVLTTAQLTARLAAAAMSGGGAVAVDTEAVEVHSGSAIATGGGRLAIATLGDRRLRIATSGAGPATLDATSSRQAEVAMTGAGRARIRTAGTRGGFTQVLIISPR